MSPAEAAEKLIEAKPGHVESTRKEQFTILKRMLGDFKEMGLDLSTLTDDHITHYRRWLKEQVDDGTLKTNSAAHYTKSWNAAMRAAFGRTGEDGEPLVAGQGLLFTIFAQEPKVIKRYGNSELDRLIQALPEVNFNNTKRRTSERARRSMHAYLETARCAGPRYRSVMNEKFLACHIDFKEGRAVLEHMKNKEEGHIIVLNPAALSANRALIKCIQAEGDWEGPETKLFVDEYGKPYTNQWVNQVLKRCAKVAGITKPISTHVLRKSVGTLIGRENEALGAHQLGITKEMFEKHYNMPTDEDVAARRDILPGSHWRPTTPEEIIGAALCELEDGRIDQPEFMARREAARKLKALPARTEYDPIYG